MAWRELDVMVLGGPDFSPHDVVALLGRVVSLPGVTGFDYRDERGDRSPTGERRDERYHVNIRLGEWRIDLSIWLYDDHINVTEWHRALAARITDEERLAVLRIKDVWHRRPEYPDEVSGLEIYTAVLDHGVRTPEAFGVWLACRGDIGVVVGYESRFRDIMLTQLEDRAERGSADPDDLGDAGHAVGVQREEHAVAGQGDARVGRNGQPVAAGRPRSGSGAIRRWSVLTLWVAVPSPDDREPGDRPVGGDRDGAPFAAVVGARR